MKARGFKMIIMGLLVLGAFTAVVMLLWNLLIPGIFGLAAINFWQALGIFVLARILFGGFGLGRMMHPGMHGRGNPIHEKWRKMTPEQRRIFIEKRKKFGFGGPFGGDCCKEHEEPGKKDE